MVSRAFSFLSFDSVALDLAMQVTALDSEHLSRPGHVPIVLFQRAQNKVPLELLPGVAKVAPRLGFCAGSLPLDPGAGQGGGDRLILEMREQRGGGNESPVLA